MSSNLRVIFQKVSVRLFLFVSAMRIHISSEMKQALDALGGFRTEHRGLIDVKVSCKTFKVCVLTDISCQGLNNFNYYAYMLRGSETEVSLDMESVQYFYNSVLMF